jgi:hypothetical protein
MYARRRHPLTALTILAFILACAVSASAQETRARTGGTLRLDAQALRLDALALAAPVVAGATAPVLATTTAPVAESSPLAVDRMRRGRALLTAGVTMLVSGGAMLALLGGKSSCGEDGSRRHLMAPLVAGGLVAGVGLTMTLGGSFKLAGVPRDFRRDHPPSAGKRVGMALGALGLGVLTQALMWAVSVPEIIDCSTS